jgi:hypothetical protein
MLYTHTRHRIPSYALIANSYSWLCCSVTSSFFLSFFLSFFSFVVGGYITGALSTVKYHRLKVGVTGKLSEKNLRRKRPLPKITTNFRVDRKNMVNIGRTYRCPGGDSPAISVFSSNHHHWIQLVEHLAETGRKAEVWRELTMSATHMTSSAASLCPDMTTTLTA